jgi:hypothetical protein
MYGETLRAAGMVLIVEIVYNGEVSVKYVCYQCPPHSQEGRLPPSRALVITRALMPSCVLTCPRITGATRSL